MGEAKRTRSRSRVKILADDPRCIYCAAPSDTVEHMPPIAFFLKRQRLSGMEFGACASCNNGTRGSDAVAAMIARLAFMPDRNSNLFIEALDLRNAVIQRAPGVMEELASANRTYVRSHSGLLMPAMEVSPGPHIKRHLDVFSAKYGMALFRNHTGIALPINGLVGSSWFLNRGLTQQHADTLLQIMPAHSMLKQGNINSSKEYEYKFNCDNKTTLVALSRFHQGLSIFSVVTTTPKLFGFPEKSFPNMRWVKLGSLLEI